MPDATYGHQDRGSTGAYASYYAGMDASMQQKVALTTAHFPTSGTVVDMGSGSGRGTYDLACLHPELTLVRRRWTPQQRCSSGLTCAT